MLHEFHGYWRLGVGLRGDEALCLRRPSDARPSVYREVSPPERQLREACESVTCARARVSRWRLQCRRDEDNDRLPATFVIDNESGRRGRQDKEVRLPILYGKHDLDIRPITPFVGLIAGFAGKNKRQNNTRCTREAAGGGHLHDDIDSLLQLHYLPPLYATAALFPASFLLFSTSHCYEIVINSVVPGVDLITSSVMAQII